MHYSITICYISYMQNSDEQISESEVVYFDIVSSKTCAVFRINSEKTPIIDKQGNVEHSYAVKPEKLPLRYRKLCRKKILPTETEKALRHFKIKI